MRGNPTAKANRAARRKNRLAAAKKGHREVTLEQIGTRDRWRCCVCGQRVAPELATLEHRTPISRGGKHIPSNLGVAHAKCNSEKGDKTAAEVAKAKKRPGLKRRAFRRKPKPVEERVAQRRQRGKLDEASLLPFIDEIPSDEVF
jgi:5-methylcytosine-specific restriction endonuclease McrA